MRYNSNLWCLYNISCSFKINSETLKVNEVSNPRVENVRNVTVAMLVFH